LVVAFEDEGNSGEEVEDKHECLSGQMFPQVDGHGEGAYVGLPLRSVKLNEVEGSEDR
jgi:hypothetical protein